MYNFYNFRKVSQLENDNFKLCKNCLRLGNTCVNHKEFEKIYTGKADINLKDVSVCDAFKN